MEDILLNVPDVMTQGKRSALDRRMCMTEKSGFGRSRLLKYGDWL